MSDKSGVDPRYGRPQRTDAMDTYTSNYSRASLGSGQVESDPEKRIIHFGSQPDDLPKPKQPDEVPVVPENEPVPEPPIGPRPKPKSGVLRALSVKLFGFRP